ncbi:MAG: Tol-Pal system beta propeller repeat protein TolB [Pseudomonadota bacterium]
MKRRTLLQALPAASAALAAPAALAQFRVDISGVGATQLPIAIAAFKGEAGAPQTISAIVRADLERSGLFRPVDAAGVQLDEVQRPSLADWKARGADALLVGSLSRLADGRYDARFRLWDVVKGRDLAGQSIVVAAGDLRLAAHRIADIVFELLTGDKGVFSTRIAYVSKAGRRHTLWVADADGEGAQSALASPEPIISPAWSPDGRSLAYVSFERGKANVFVQDILSGQRKLVANFRGSNSAPAFSPDGRRLAVTLTQDGISQLYTMDVDGGGVRRLTQSNAIDTEAAWSPDGASLYFVSDRGGGPQVYRMPASGGSAQRITFQGAYNISPMPSPDGRSLVYVTRGDGFRLQLMDLASGQVQSLTTTSDDESPSFAPNSRLILFATRAQGRDVLMTTSVDGRIKATLATRVGDVREPAWGPYGR